MHLVIDSSRIALTRISSVLFRNAAIFKVYAREAAQDCFEPIDLLYTKAQNGLDYSLVQALLTYEKYLAELQNDVQHLQDEAEKKQVRARFNSAVKCHSGDSPKIL